MRMGEQAHAEEDFRQVIKLETVPEKAECAYYAYYYLGDKGTAITWLNKVLEKGDEGDYYDAACLYAEMGEQKKALNYLRESLHRGFRRFAHIHRDRMLDNIRNLPDFKELLKEYEEIHAEEVKLSFVLPSSEFYLQSIDGLLTCDSLRVGITIWRAAYTPPNNHRVRSDLFEASCANDVGS